MSKNTNSRKRSRNRRQSKKEYSYDEIVKHYKTHAIKEYGHLGKKDIIGRAIESFILTNINQITPIPKMLKRCMAGEQISFNMLLDSIGEDGIVIGATAFRIAEQLEIELNDNGSKGNRQNIVAYVNGEERPDIPCEDVDFSRIYNKYFRIHPDSIFLQNGYLYERIRDNSGKYDTNNIKISESLLQMQIVCNENLLLLFAHHHMKKIYFNMSIEDMPERLSCLKDFYEDFVNEYREDTNSEQYKSAVLACTSIAATLNEIEEYIGGDREI